MGDIMHIGISALTANQTALSVASQNIANANTPFYSRREVDFIENPYRTGVNVADVRRVFDTAANTLAHETNTEFSKWDIYASQIANFEPLLDNDNISINKFINDSLAALRQIESNFSPSNRALYLSKLSDVANQFHTVDREINRQITNTNLSLQGEVDQVNNIVGDLNAINRQVLDSAPPINPELLDQREALVQELSRYMNISSAEDKFGKLEVSLSNGLSLLATDPPMKFITEQDPSNPFFLKIAAKNGASTLNIDGLISNGEIAGYLNFRDHVLAPAQQALNRLALVFADKLNEQNKLGIDDSGEIGKNIFNDINSTSMTSNRVIPNALNAGTSSINVTINDVSQLKNSNYQLTFGAGNTYKLMRLSDNAVVNTGTASTLPTNVTVDGFTMRLASGTFPSGDQYIISPTLGGANNLMLSINDPSQLALGWPVTAAAGNQQPGSNGQITVTSITDTTNASFATPNQLDPPIEIRFAVNSGVLQYSLYDASNSTLIEGPITYVNGAEVFPTSGGVDPGYRVKLSGDHIQAGDTFNITYNLNAAGDNRNAKASAALFQAGTVLGADNILVNFSQAYGLLSSDVSVKTNEANQRLQTSQSIKEQADARRDSISGVSLEEESLNLSQFQASYQASAQVLQIAKNILDIIGSLRG